MTAAQTDNQPLPYLGADYTLEEAHSVVLHLLIVGCICLSSKQHNFGCNFGLSLNVLLKFDTNKFISEAVSLGVSLPNKCLKSCRFSGTHL